MTLNILHGINLYVGNDPIAEASKHLQLEELKLPDLEENLQTFEPGGSVGATQIAMGLKEMEASFKLKGWDMHTLTHFGLGAGIRKRFTGYGAIRDEVTGMEKDVVAVMEGRLTKVEGEAMKKGDLSGHDYTISGIWFYRLSIGGTELYQISIDPPRRRVAGVDHFAGVRSALRIPG